ncbi:MAG: GHMP kinase [Veillonella sp.]|nr:GHMP kinase [Veillonella sp.]
MTYYVRAPGTCGEFLQGSIDGQSFLVTCPINRYSYALSNVIQPFSKEFCALQPKSAQARKLVQELVQQKNKNQICPPVYVRSDILQGKGMASSSADISVTAMATALAMDYDLSLKELEQICLSVEPTDASFYQGVTQFDYIKGTISKPLGMCPPLKILVFDEGGSIDTVSFNKQADLQNKILEKESIIQESFDLFKQGLITHDIKLIGQAATLSAFGNQRILYKPNLYDFHDVGNSYNSVGTIIAHSGTIMGLLFPVDYGRIDDCKNEILRKLPQLSYVDTVETTNEGLTYIKR